MRKAALLAAATICVVLGPSAVAGPDPVRTVRVLVTSHDLHTAEGRAELEAQVDRAVDTVCGKTSDPQESRKHEAYSCRRDTVPNVRAQLAALTDSRLRKVTIEHVSGGR